MRFHTKCYSNQFSGLCSFLVWVLHTHKAPVAEEGLLVDIVQFFQLLVLLTASNG